MKLTDASLGVQQDALFQFDIMTGRPYRIEYVVTPHDCALITVREHALRAIPRWEYTFPLPFVPTASEGLRIMERLRDRASIIINSLTITRTGLIVHERAQPLIAELRTECADLDARYYGKVVPMLASDYLVDWRVDICELIPPDATVGFLEFLATDLESGINGGISHFCPLGLRHAGVGRLGNYIKLTDAVGWLCVLAYGA